MLFSVHFSHAGATTLHYFEQLLHFTESSRLLNANQTDDCDHYALALSLTIGLSIPPCFTYTISFLVQFLLLKSK